MGRKNACTGAALTITTANAVVYVFWDNWFEHFGILGIGNGRVRIAQIYLLYEPDVCLMLSLGRIHINQLSSSLRISSFLCWKL